MWLGMSSGPSSVWTNHGVLSGTKRSKNSSKSRRALGSAFSMITRLAEVWRTKTVTVPVAIPLRSTIPATSPLIS